MLNRRKILILSITITEKYYYNKLNGGGEERFPEVVGDPNRLRPKFTVNDLLFEAVW